MDGNVFVLSARNSGNKHEGLLHTLTINGDGIDEIAINEWIIDQKLHHPLALPNRNLFEQFTQHIYKYKWVHAHKITFSIKQRCPIIDIGGTIWRISSQEESVFLALIYIHRLLCYEFKQTKALIFNRFSVLNREACNNWFHCVQSCFQISVTHSHKHTQTPTSEHGISDQLYSRLLPKNGRSAWLQMSQKICYMLISFWMMAEAGSSFNRLRASGSCNCLSPAYLSFVFVGPEDIVSFYRVLIIGQRKRWFLFHPKNMFDFIYFRKFEIKQPFNGRAPNSRINLH